MFIHLIRIFVHWGIQSTKQKGQRIKPQLYIAFALTGIIRQGINDCRYYYK